MLNFRMVDVEQKVVSWPSSWSSPLVPFSTTCSYAWNKPSNPEEGTPDERSMHRTVLNSSEAKGRSFRSNSPSSGMVIRRVNTQHFECLPLGCGNPFSSATRWRPTHCGVATHAVRRFRTMCLSMLCRLLKASLAFWDLLLENSGSSLSTRFNSFKASP